MNANSPTAIPPTNMAVPVHKYGFGIGLLSADDGCSTGCIEAPRRSPATADVLIETMRSIRTKGRSTCMVMTPRANRFLPQKLRAELNAPGRDEVDRYAERGRRSELRSEPLERRAVREVQRIEKEGQ